MPLGAYIKLQKLTELPRSTMQMFIKIQKNNLLMMCNFLSVMASVFTVRLPFEISFLTILLV